MSNNPILDELRAAREKLLADAGGDLQQLVRGICERQEKSGHRVVAIPVGQTRPKQGNAEVGVSKAALS